MITFRSLTRLTAALGAVSLLSGPALAQGEPTGGEAPTAAAGGPTGERVPGIVATTHREAANGQVEREETIEVSLPPGQPTVKYTFTTRNGTLSGAVLLGERYQRAASPALAGVPPEKFAAGPIDMVSTWSTRYLPFGLGFAELEYAAQAVVTLRKGAVDGVVDQGFLLPPAKREALLVDKPVQKGDELVITAPASLAKTYAVRDVGAGGTITPDPAFPAGKVEGVAYEVRRRGGVRALYEADPTYTRTSPDGGLPLTYVWPDPAHDQSPVWFERRFDAGKQGYELQLTVTVHNLGDQVLRVNPEIRVAAWQHPANMSSSMFGGPTPIMEGSCMTQEGVEHAPFGSLHETAIENLQANSPEGAMATKIFAMPTSWASVGTNYFIAAVVPLLAQPGGQCKLTLRDFNPAAPGNWVMSASWFGSSVQSIQGRPAGTGTPGTGGCLPGWLPASSPIGQGALRCTEAFKALGVPETATLKEIESAWAAARKSADTAAADAAKEALSGRKQATWRFVIYNGPKEGQALALTSPELEESVQFGWMSFIGRPLHKVMVWFHGGLGSWPLAIILLTIILKLVTWPLNTKSYRSLLKMQQLKPKLDELKKKIGDDRQRFAQEQMALYKREGINPLAGCLPMLLQFPIWVGLYGAILGSVELYHEPLGLWVPDLSAPDPAFVMPILLGVLMFLQTWLTPSAGGTDPMQQKIMKFGMPILFTLFMLFLPSGLVLYIIVNTLLTIGQNILIRRKYAAPS
ncbi:MAG: YidC/Oxa1 family insertase periplasmic-domain containing protein [Deltaproteobacteria bacterium]|nr:YidC/Oxa1 family insertase periplasmic-domain containing protein [Deltaproteobacteria bacterium]